MKGIWPNNRWIDRVNPYDETSFFHDRWLLAYLTLWFWMALPIVTVFAGVLILVASV